MVLWSWLLDEGKCGNLPAGYSDYLTGLRIAAARELLEKTNMRMYEVCDAVGYNSVEHFLRTFKRATGQTPLQYRKENVKKHQ